MSISAQDLKPCGVDYFQRYLVRHQILKVYYCVLEPGLTLEDVLVGKTELYYKGQNREGEPEYPVTLTL